jgi:hypothetical protein
VTHVLFNIINYLQQYKKLIHPSFFRKKRECYRSRKPNNMSE